MKQKNPVDLQILLEHQGRDIKRLEYQIKRLEEGKPATVAFDPDALQALVLAHGNDITALRLEVHTLLDAVAVMEKIIQQFGINQGDHGVRLDGIDNVLADVASFAGKTESRLEKLELWRDGVNRGWNKC